MHTSSKGQATAIGVKSHVLFSKLLTSEEYWELLGLDSVSEIANFLKQTEGYKEEIEPLSSVHVHRVDLENAVESSILVEATSFLYYLSGPRQQFFIDWLGWYEAEHLKSIFRWVNTKRLNSEEMKKRLFVVPGSKLSYDLLLDSKNYNDVLLALKETKYYKILVEPVKRLMEGEKSLLSLEIAIDNLVETSLYNNIKNLPKKDQKILEPLFGSRIDLLKLYNFHRCIWYYHMTPEETLSRLLPIKYKVKTQHLRDMTKGTTWKERVEILATSFPVYAGIFRNALGQEDMELALEMSIKRYNYLKALAIFQKGPPGFHTAISYFILKSHELDDVVRVIENVRYDFDRRNAANYLIRPIISGGEPKWQ